MKDSCKVDMRSDTVSRSSSLMRERVVVCRVGDDVYGEDESVKELETMVSGMLGKESGLLVLSGTMGNLISLMVHCGEKGQSAILGSNSHIVNYEAGGVAAIANVMLTLVQNTARGELDLAHLEHLLASRDNSNIHIPHPTLICLENTHCNSSGQSISLDHMRQVRQIANQHQLKMHLDGARLFNAAQQLHASPLQIAQYFDTVSLCLSKGLGCPIGSLILGSHLHINKARQFRKMLGGGMRQAGLIAAQAISILKNGLYIK